MSKGKETTPITEQQVLDIQKKWGEGIIRIGRVFLDNGDYRTEAEKHINTLYGYSLGPVLFKPTLAFQKQFRTTREGALSYFVGDNENYPEDRGFAIRPWNNIRWENIGINIIGTVAMVMGNYFLTSMDGGNEIKVEYTIVYTRDADGKLRIILHDSHFPCSQN